MNVRLLKLVAPIALVSLILAACGGSDDGASDSDGELTSIRVAPTVPGPLYWPYYWSAAGLGFYEEEGLEVEIIPVEATVPQALMAGQLDLGGVGADFIEQGAEIKDLRWFMMTDAYLFQAIVPGDSPYQSVTDLAGKRIGINDPHDEYDAEYVLTSAGIERGNYELIPTGEVIPSAQATLDGQIDAWVNPVGSDWIALQEAFPDEGFRILFNPGTEGMYGTGLITTADRIANDRETVVAFGRAIARAMIWHQENPEATAAAVLEVEPNAADSVEAAMPFIRRSAEYNRWVYEARGRIDESIIQRSIDLAAELGFLDESYPASSNLDLTLYEEIWDFDVDAEIARARE